MKKIDNVKILTAGAIIASVSSFFAGYNYAVMKLKASYDAIYHEALDKTIDETKEFYREKYDTELAKATARLNDSMKEKLLPAPTPAELIPPENVAARAAMTKYQGLSAVPDTKVPAAAANYLKASEEADRAILFGKKPPYIITLDEYASENSGYEQYTLTYHVPDDMLVKLNGDEFKGKIDQVVGRDNLQKFGQDSGDPGCVYIRNEALEFDIELIRDLNPYFPEEDDAPTTG